MAVRRIRLWRSTCRRSQFLSGFRVIANIDIRSSEIFPGTCLGDSCPGPLPVSVGPLLRNGRSRIAATDRRPCGNSSAGLWKDVRFWSRSDNTPKPVRCNTFCRYGVERSRRKVGPDTFWLRRSPGSPAPCVREELCGLSLQPDGLRL